MHSQHINHNVDAGQRAEAAPHAHHRKTGLRLFSCGFCGHNLRFGAHRCGDCFSPTPLQNRRATWYVLGAGLVLLCLAGLAALL